MPPKHSKAPTANKSGSKAKAAPYAKNAKTAPNKKSVNVSKPTQARNKHKNVNLTSELDSLLGDLNSQLHRKKTKRDVRLDVNNPNAVSASEKALDEAQAKHESLQQDMMSALDGISSLGK